MKLTLIIIFIFVLNSIGYPILTEKIKFIGKIYNKDSVDIVIEDLHDLNLNLDIISYNLITDRNYNIKDVNLDLYKCDTLSFLNKKKIKIELERLIKDSTNLICFNSIKKDFTDSDSSKYYFQFVMYSKNHIDYKTSKYNCR